MRQVCLCVCVEREREIYYIIHASKDGGEGANDAARVDEQTIGDGDDDDPVNVRGVVKNDCFFWMTRQSGVLFQRLRCGR